jgi:hypothetical protein
MGAFNFTCIPTYAWEALLLQAWQHLDQRHRFGIIPRVCSSWYHLSLPTFKTLKLVIRNQEAANHLGLWLVRHGSTLQHLNLDLGPPFALAAKGIHALQELADGIRSCTSLCSLQLKGRGSSNLVLDFAKMTQLTSLHVCDASTLCCNIQQFLQLPPQVRCLGFKDTTMYGNESEIHSLLTRLPKLTSLDLRQTSIPLEHLASCPRLAPLQDLKLTLEWVREEKRDALARLPCTHLEVEFGDMEDIEAFNEWCAGQHGKHCLGRLVSLKCSLYDDWEEGPCADVLLPRLASAATNLRHLGVTGDFAGIGDLSLLSGLKQLTSLNFTYKGPADADVVASLTALHDLQQLSVAELSDEQLNAVRAAAASGQLPSLKEVKVVSEWDDFLV